MRRRFWLMGLAMVFCLCVAMSASAEGDGSRQSRALLIGVDEFVSRESTYPSSTNNVFAMQEALVGSAQPFETIYCPPEAPTDAGKLAELIAAVFADADDDDVNYLYISTHGVYQPQIDTEPYLLLSDGSTEGRVTACELEAAFEGVRGTNVLLLDACNSGAFIGKGESVQPETVHFLGERFKVLCSSGAMEESWYWNTSDSTERTLIERGPQGAFYFTQALSQGIGGAYGYPADANRDGEVTMLELYNYLLENHAASTPQTYPQSSDFVLFRYNTTEAASVTSPVTDVTFSGSTLSTAENELSLEFTAMRPIRVGYQIVYLREGKWRFDEAQVLYDNVERYTAFGDEPGAVTAGRKVRTLRISLQAGETNGYVLVQLVSIENGRLTVHAGRVIAIPPADGELSLSVGVADRYELASAKELAIFVSHEYPCVLSVAIVNENGDIVRRLCHRTSTRPMQISGSTFYWDGTDKNGELVPEGTYRVRVSALMNELTFTVVSDGVRVLSSDG